MEKPRQLIFEGHLIEEIAPRNFKVLEPFPIDGKAWLLKNSRSGKTLYCRDGCVYAVSFDYDASGVIQNTLYEKGDKVFMSNPASLTIGGCYL